MKTKINNINKKIGYQIFPLSFNDSNNDGIGDLNGIIAKLPYLKDLGIDIIWLCPIYQSNFSDAGYDVINYYQIDKRFGTMLDFKRLIKKAKQLNIDIMMDFVINHGSIDSYEFKQACLSKNNYYHDFFIWEDNPNLNDQSIFGNCAWQYVDSVQQYYLHIFTKQQADFNFHSDKFKQWLFKILKFWIKKGVKYFRFDAIEHIGKTIKPFEIRYGKYNKQFLKEITAKVFKKYDVYIIGESWNITPELMQQYCIKEKIINSFFNFSLFSLDWKNQFASLAKIKNKPNFKDLKGYFEWQEKNLLTATAWTNHDVPRAIERYFKTDNSNRYYVQTLMAILLMTTKGIPFIYQGEEFGMSRTDIKSFSDFKDLQVDNRKNEFINKYKYTQKQYFDANLSGSRDMSRSIMAWNKIKNCGFTSETIKPFYNSSVNFEHINLANDLVNKNSIFLFLKKLIYLRKNYYYDIFNNFDEIEIIKLEKDFTHYKIKKNNLIINISLNWANQIKVINREINHIILSNYKNEEIKQNIINPFEATIYEGD